jgi:hypothetical protein
MSTSAYAWQGIVTYYTASTSCTVAAARGTRTQVKYIKKVPAPTYTAEDIDVTDQDSGGVKEYIAGLKEGSEVEFVMNDIPSDPGQKALDGDEGNTGLIEHIFPSGRSITYNITIKTVNIIEDGKAGALSVKGKVTGTISKGTDLIPLDSLAVSVGTIFPAFSATVYEYQLPEVNATDKIKVTPSISSDNVTAGGVITVNGTAVADGVASGDIALTAGSITNIEVRVACAGKTATVYKIKAARAAS